MKILHTPHHFFSQIYSGVKRRKKMFAWERCLRHQIEDALDNLSFVENFNHFTSHPQFCFDDNEDL